MYGSKIIKVYLFTYICKLLKCISIESRTNQWSEMEHTKYKIQVYLLLLLGMHRYQYRYRCRYFVKILVLVLVLNGRYQAPIPLISISLHQTGRAMLTQNVIYCPTCPTTL